MSNICPWSLSSGFCLKNVTIEMRHLLQIKKTKLTCKNAKNFLTKRDKCERAQTKQTKNTGRSSWWQKLYLNSHFSSSSRHLGPLQTLTLCLWHNAEVSYVSRDFVLLFSEMWVVRFEMHQILDNWQTDFVSIFFSEGMSWNLFRSTEVEVIKVARGR